MNNSPSSHGYNLIGESVQYTTLFVYSRLYITLLVTGFKAAASTLPSQMVTDAPIFGRLLFQVPLLKSNADSW